MKKKKIIIGIIVLIIIIVLATLLSLYLIERRKYDYKIEKVTEINYYIINKEDRYGVIDKQGNIIVDPVYDIIQIPNPSKPIFICMSDYNTEKREYTIKVLNEKGEALYQEYNNVQAIPNETTEDEVPFEKTVLKYKENGKYGILNINGKKMTEPIYDQISSIGYKEGMLLVKQGESFGIINIKGVVVIPVEYNSITTDNYYDKETKYQKSGFIVSQKKDDGYKYGYVDYRGRIIVDTIYTEIERVNEINATKDVYLVALKNGQAGLLKNDKEILNYEYEDISYNSYNDVFVIQRNGKQGIVDRKGNTNIAIEYENILFGGILVNAEKDGVITVLNIDGSVAENQNILLKIPTQDGKHYIVSDKDEIYKIVDEEGKVIIDKGYSYIEEIVQNYYIVATGNSNGIIDLEGMALVPLKYNSIFELEGTDLLQATISSTNSVALINKNMQVIAGMDSAAIKVTDEYILMYSNTENRYFDYQGNELTTRQVYSENTLYAKKINDKWGFADKNDELKIEAQYDMVTEFNEYGFAGIQKDGKWGVIDSEGNVIQEPIYEIKWANPEFIGKYYKEIQWYGDLYYTDKIEE